MAPLWLARTTEDEKRDGLPKPSDSFDVVWWGSFKRDVLSDQLDGTFFPVCKIPWEVTQARKPALRYHPYRDDDCPGKGCKVNSRNHCWHGGKLREGHGPYADAFRPAALTLVSIPAHM